MRWRLARLHHRSMPVIFDYSADLLKKSASRRSDPARDVFRQFDSLSGGSRSWVGPRRSSGRRRGAAPMSSRIDPADGTPAPPWHLATRWPVTPLEGSPVRKSDVQHMTLKKACTAGRMGRVLRGTPIRP